MNKPISAAEFIKEQSENTVIIDVRNTDEYAYKHVNGSINIPLDQINSRIGEIPKNEPVYIICQSGARSQSACDRLNQLGLNNLRSIQGGIIAAEKSGAQIIQTSKKLPLMQQVQIAAGSLVLLGLVLSSIFHPAFIYISYFVGAGLVFAGFSGFCGMGLLLQKMPWNKNTPGDSSCVK